MVLTIKCMIKDIQYLTSFIKKRRLLGEEIEVKKKMIYSIFRFIGILMVISPVLLYGQNIVDAKVAFIIFILGAMITFSYGFRKDT